MLNVPFENASIPLPMSLGITRFTALPNNARITKKETMPE
jgi:hypothetical protein